MNRLSVRNLSKHFVIHHLQRRLSIFEGISFRLDAGCFLLVSGPNGSGKSTLLRCLYRSYLPSGGEALYQSNRGEIDLARAADIDIALLRREEIGFVTQFLRPRPRVTALDLVAEPLLADGRAPGEALDEASGFLDRFGFKPELRNAYPTTFSGGEQQKVNLARALIHPRKLLLLDEPTASLDRNARKALAELLGELKERGAAMIGILHHPEDMEGLIDEELKLSLPEPAAGEERMEEAGHVAE